MHGLSAGRKLLPQSPLSGPAESNQAKPSHASRAGCTKQDCLARVRLLAAR